MAKLHITAKLDNKDNTYWCHLSYSYNTDHDYEIVDITKSVRTDKVH